GLGADRTAADAALPKRRGRRRSALWDHACPNAQLDLPSTGFGRCMADPWATDACGQHLSAAHGATQTGSHLSIDAYPALAQSATARRAFAAAHTPWRTTSEYNRR